MTTHDRITKLLLNRTPSIEDTGRALLRAVGGESTFGEELNAIRAGRIQDEATLYDVFTKERGAKLAERKQASAEKQHVWEKLQAARKQGNTDATAILKAIEFYSGDDLKDRRVLAEELEKLPGDVTASNAWNIASQTAKSLTLRGRFSGRGKSKSTMADRKLALLNKWRSAQEGRGEWNDTDQAEWDMIIRADPMDVLRRNILREIAPGSAQAPGGAQAASPGGEPLAFVTPLGPPDEQPRALPEYDASSAAQNPPRLSNGGIDRNRLVVDQVYLHPVDGQLYRWTGTEFVLAR